MFDEEAHHMMVVTTGVGTSTWAYGGRGWWDDAARAVAALCQDDEKAGLVLAGNAAYVFDLTLAV